MYAITKIMHIIKILANAITTQVQHKLQNLAKINDFFTRIINTNSTQIQTHKFLLYA